MKIVNLKCPNCGSLLKVEEGTKKVICDYCKGEVILDDESINIKHSFSGQVSEEQKFINAESNLKIKNFSGSYGIYYSLSKKYVNNPKVWIGLLRSYTHDFTYKEDSEYFKNNCSKYWTSFESFATKEEIDVYKSKYENYLNDETIKPVKEKNNLKFLYLIPIIVIGIPVVLFIIGIIIFFAASKQTIEVNHEKIDDTINMTELDDVVDEYEVYSFNFNYSNGEKWGSLVKSTIDNVIENNKTDDRKISVKYGDVNTSNPDELLTLKKNFDNFTSYEVVLDYDEDGFINLITILDIE